jgi:hypothetical protein
MPFASGGYRCDALAVTRGGVQATAMPAPGRPAGSGYTPIVSWRQRIAIVLLTILVGLPFSGTVCAMLCDSPPTAAAAAHHGAGKDCEESVPATTGLQVSGVLAHDCSTHDGGIQPIVTAAPERPNVKTISPPTPADVVRATLAAVPRPPSTFHRDRPGTAPPTTTPLVLRV